MTCPVQQTAFTLAILNQISFLVLDLKGLNADMAPLSLLPATLLGAVLSAVQVDAHGIATAMVVFPTGTL